MSDPYVDVAFWPLVYAAFGWEASAESRLAGAVATPAGAAKGEPGAMTSRLQYVGRSYSISRTCLAQTPGRIQKVEPPILESKTPVVQIPEL